MNTYRNTHIQKYRNTYIQKYRNTYIQKYIHTYDKGNPYWLKYSFLSPKTGPHY